MALTSEGRIDVDLGYDAGQYGEVDSVVQLTANGSVNLRFGNDGRAGIALLGAGHSLGGAMLLDAQGNIVVASMQQFGIPSPGGVGSNIRYATDYGGVLRLTPAGQRDPTFGRLGVRILDVGRTDSPVAGTQVWLYLPNGDIIAEFEILEKGVATDALLDSPLRV
jgi:hypothetical protein